MSKQGVKRQFKNFYFKVYQTKSYSIEKSDHFPKQKQNICPKSEEGDLFEMMNCRNSVVRKKAERGIDAIIKLRDSNPVVALDDEYSLQPLKKKLYRHVTSD